MTLPALNLWMAAALLLAVLLASARQLRAPRRPLPRLLAVVLLQAVAAALLYAALLPPQVPVQAHGRLVLGADAGAAGALLTSDAPPLLLPEAGDVPGGIRVPDLATALRQYPAAALTLVGAGLTARDRDTALPVPLHWQPSPQPRGWSALQPPPAVAPGARFELQARAHGVAHGKAELLDPADAVVDRAALASDGRVQLSGVARAAGRSVFRLRLLDAAGDVVETVPVPQQTVTGAPLRMRVRAGAPGAELKYLRRWATDTGIVTQVQSDAGAGLSLGDGNVAIDAATLARTDLLVLDERSLAALGGGQLAALRGALQAGLGVLVRSTGAPAPAARQRLAQLGLPVQGDGSSASVQLRDGGDGPMLQARRGPLAAATLPTADGREADRHSHDAALPALEQLALRATSGHALLHGAQGEAIGGWQAVGQGRVGLLPLTDTWRWVLAGRDDRHGELWSHIVSVLARAQPRTDPLWSPQPLAWAGQRQLLCGVEDALSQQGTPLLVDPASGPQRCAAWWPREAGWQPLQLGEQTLWRYVFDPASAHALHHAVMAEATAQRVADSGMDSAVPTQTAPGSRWPWWVALLLTLTLLWWLERRPRSL